MDIRKDIVSMSFEELSSEFKEMGLPKFRATQIYDWLHKKCVASFEEMTNISKDLIVKLNDNFVIFLSPENQSLASKVGGIKSPEIMSLCLLVNFCHFVWPLR